MSMIVGPAIQSPQVLKNDLAKATGATLVSLATGYTVSSFAADIGLGISGYADLQTALNGGTAGDSHVVRAPKGSTSTGKVSLAAGYQTTFEGRGSGGTYLGFTHSDGTQAISIGAMSSDKYVARLRAIQVQGDATQGDGIKATSPAAGFDLDDLLFRDFSGAGKSSYALSSVYISRMDRITAFGSDYGLYCQDVKGIEGRAWWLADNLTYQAYFDGDCVGNYIAITELGLSSIDTTKAALNIAGANSRFRLNFVENFTAPRPFFFGSTAYNVELDVLFCDYLDVYDNGHFNVYPTTANLPIKNRLGADSFFGGLLGDGDLSNEFANSSWGQGSGARFAGFGATAATVSVDNTLGYSDSNSLKLDFGTDKLTGAQINVGLPMVAGDFAVWRFKLRCERDFEATETFLANLRDGGGTFLHAKRVSDVRAGKWREVAVAYLATAAITVYLQPSLAAAAVHTDFVVYMDDLSISLNGKSYTNLTNSTAAAMTRSRRGLFAEAFGARDLAVETPTGEIAQVGGVLYRDMADHATTAVVTPEVLATYTLPAYTLDSANSGVRITAFGECAANANNKTVEIQVAGAVVSRSGAVPIAANGTKWRLVAEVFRTTASNQNKTAGSGTFNDAAVPVLVLNPGADFSADIDLDCVGTNGTANAGDITCQGFIVELLP